MGLFRPRQRRDSDYHGPQTQEKPLSTLGMGEACERPVPRNVWRNEGDLAQAVQLSSEEGRIYIFGRKP